MSSITGSVGANGGIRIPPLDAPTPTIRGNMTWIITSLWDASYKSAWTTTGGYLYVPFEYGWRAFTFQLLPGTGVSANVTIAATNDPPTAQGVNGVQPSGPDWETVSSAMPGFPNPIPLNGPIRVLYVNSGPWTAFRISTAGGFPGGSGATLLFGAAN